MRVGGQAATGVGQLLAEAVELSVGESTFQVSPSIDTGGCVSLEVHLIAAAGVVGAAEKMVETNLVQGG